MAFHVSRNVGWGSNYTPDPSQYYTFKMWFYIDVDVECIAMNNGVATIRVWGNYRVVNSATGGPPNRIGAASDYAVLAGGTWDKSAYAFDPAQNYYKRALPMVPNASQDFINNRLVLEFRGDTYIREGNHSSCWVKGGTINPNYDGATFDRTYPIDVTFPLEIPATGDVPVLTWTTSGWTPPHLQEWLVQETWASWFDLKWNATLHFDANGGSNAPADAVVETTGGSAVVTIPNGKPTWTWHRFDGWSRNRSATIPDYRPGDRVTVNRNENPVTLYAVWTEWYRVGDVRYNGTYRTTHRSGGKCHLRKNGAWVEMRSIDAGFTEPIDPPNRRKNGRWQNQYKIGSP